MLVATPIGNLGDLAPRAVEALRCGSARLLRGHPPHRAAAAARRRRAPSAWPSPTSTPSWRGIGEVLDVLGAGGDVAVVTDAGTPGISDPGERLVRAALDAGYEVTAVPGPAAVVMAVTISGLPTDAVRVRGVPAPLRAASAPSAWPRSPPSRARSCSTRRRTASQRTIADLAAACGDDRHGRRVPRADQAVRDGRARHARRRSTSASRAASTWSCSPGARRTTTDRRRRPRSATRCAPSWPPARSKTRRGRPPVSEAPRRARARPSTRWRSTLGPESAIRRSTPR